MIRCPGCERSLGHCVAAGPGANDACGPAEICYNIGRVAAGLGTVPIGPFLTAADTRLAIFQAAFRFLPAAARACLLPGSADETLPPDRGPAG